MEQNERFQAVLDLIEEHGYCRSGWNPSGTRLSPPWNLGGDSFTVDGSERTYVYGSTIASMARQGLVAATPDRHGLVARHSSLIHGPWTPRQAYERGLMDAAENGCPEYWGVPYTELKGLL